MTVARAARRALLLLAPIAAGCVAERDVATLRVERQAFVHRVRAEGVLVPTRATTIAVPTQVRHAARIAWRAEDGVRVEAGDVVVRFDPLEMERELEKGRADLAQSRLEGSKTDAAGDDRSRTVARERAVAELELDVAERYLKTDDSVYSRHEIIESQIDGDLAATRRAQATELEGIHQELSQTESDLLTIAKRRAEQRIEQASQALDGLEVRAPHAGLLTWNRDWSGELPEVGQQVWGGQPLAEIPSLERMKAEVYVLEADAGGLAPGLSAVLRVEAHPERAFDATVARVDAVAKSPYRGTPIQYFGVELELDAPVDQTADLRPGQRVTATLVIERRDEALVVPRQALMTDRETPYVWVRERGGFVAREVVTGPQSAALVVIDRGLDAGEVVTLEPPNAPAEKAKPAPGAEGGGDGPAATAGAAS
ncbi:MAG TPA: HlyD family efflux transporter periplasmic adaptor subunit [Thermoanaerobaculia bacterium]|nr:HlyD family efflux transporter periplasmic adaptor subunit [Thermoanaerobaculia bacterium]